MANYATLLRDHITLACRSIDRLFLQAYVPKLQSVGQVCLFLNRQRGFRIPSSAAFGQIGEAYVAAIHGWAQAEGIPIRYFAKGENKEKFVEPLLRAAAEQSVAQREGAAITQPDYALSSKPWLSPQGRAVTPATEPDFVAVDKYNSKKGARGEHVREFQVAPLK